MAKLLFKHSPPQPDNACKIWLNPRQYVKVSPEDYVLMNYYHWRIVQSAGCFYAARRSRQSGKRRWLKMHREIMHTPQGYECHHKNGIALDNRRENLENLTPAQHRAAHNKSR